MKIYKIGSPEATPKLIELDGETPIESIEIGEGGRGRTRKIIPITGDGSEIRVKKVQEEIVLVRGDWEQEERCLVVINTVGGYSRSRSYGLHNASGVYTVATGSRAFGQAGYTNGGPEILAIVSPGAVFRLNSKYSSTWYMWTENGWVVETPEERNARLALIEIEQGGGEWL